MTPLPLPLGSNGTPKTCRLLRALDCARSFVDRIGGNRDGFAFTSTIRDRGSRPSPAAAGTRSAQTLAIGLGPSNSRIVASARPRVRARDALPVIRPHRELSGRDEYSPGQMLSTGASVVEGGRSCLISPLPRGLHDGSHTPASEASRFLLPFRARRRDHGDDDAVTPNSAAHGAALEAVRTLDPTSALQHFDARAAVAASLWTSVRSAPCRRSQPSRHAVAMGLYAVSATDLADVGDGIRMRSGPAATIIVLFLRGSWCMSPRPTSGGRASRGQCCAECSCRRSRSYRSICSVVVLLAVSPLLPAWRDVACISAWTRSRTRRDYWTDRSVFAARRRLAVDGSRYVARLPHLIGLCSG